MAKKKVPHPSPPTTLPDPDLMLFPKITHLKKRAMLAAYSMCGQLRKSTDLAHIDHRYHWKWLRDDPDYAEAFREAGQYAADMIENRLIELGMEGYEEAVWHQGVQVGTQRKYLPTLLLAAVNAALPDKYKYRTTTEHTLSPQMLALQAQWQAERQRQSQIPKPMLPGHEEPVEAIPEGEITPTPSAWRIRPPGQPSRADFFGMLDRINGDRRLDDKEE